ncbi:MAG: hypothetical protein K0R00_24 [Herbinix sp.]|jgi:hypothetical protein|nr:hypothetical protein [Herbinix sp.]
MNEASMGLDQEQRMKEVERRVQNEISHGEILTEKEFNSIIEDVMKTN